MPETSPYLSIVIPVYNEEGRIGDTLAKVAAYLARRPLRAEVVVVDDGSTDATAEVVRRASAGGTAVRLLSIDHAGKGWAVRRGMLAATGEYRLLCDADLSVPIEQVERLLPPMAPDVDIAIGSREAAGAVRHGEPWRRHMMGRIFNALVRRAAVPGVGDTQCGFKCFKGGAVRELFGVQTTGGFAFDVEILYLARRRGLTIAEIGVDWHYRDMSKVSPAWDSLRMTRDVLKMRWRHRDGRAGQRDGGRG